MVDAKKEPQEIPYLRVGTSILKRVWMPLSNGRSIETLIPWNMETLRQDFGKDYFAKIPKYDGFCTVPSHTDYRRDIHGFLNRYEPISTVPAEGEFPHIRDFLEHIFGEQIELGYDYLQLLYVRPQQRLPILLLVSQERNTGKTTFLNFLKLIFEGNVTFNTNEDFRSQFNDDWTGKLLVCVDEVLLNRREDSERIKNLSTARSYKAEAKGKDRREMEFFGKFVLCSNNEHNPVLIEAGETRYWVRRVPPLTHDNQNLLADMRRELPGFLFFLLHRKLSTCEESRMWFAPRLLATEALRRIIHYNRSKAEAEIIAIIRDIMDAEELEQYRFDISDMVNMLEIRGIRSDHPTIRRILAENWQLLPAPPTYYTRYAITYNGEVIRQDSKTARVYTVTRVILDELLKCGASQ
ncbi:primase-helicase family protein [Alistipes sp.]|uniref:primase-helicase family protein n=1 Tax=Alistipes sp. TaxID=1872444 RepID=UPI003AF4D032